MDRYLVIGNPIAHSRSPWIHARFAELTQQALTYERCQAPLDAFVPTVRGLLADGVRGANVTVPFKHEAAALADELSERAALAGAANTLVFEAGRILADNTDGVGLVRDIERNAGVALKDCRVLLLGAGGAAAGVLGPLLMAQPAQVVLSNRTEARAQALIERHRSLSALQKVELSFERRPGLHGDFSVVINGTSASLAGADVGLSAQALRPGTLVVDMMYGPGAAPYLNWAAGHGARPRDGLGMLVEQAAEAFERWRGVRPPSAQVLAELRALLDAPQPSAAHG